MNYQILSKEDRLISEEKVTKLSMDHPIDWLAAQDNYDPHAFLGLHSVGDGKVIRLWRPGACSLFFEFRGEICSLQQMDKRGLFEYVVPEETQNTDYRAYDYRGELHFDPYAFDSTFGEMDQHFFHQGVHYNIYEHLGAHLTTHRGIEGVKFAVWAPNAKTVSLVGDFNHWDGRLNPMRSMGYSGVFELFIPGLKEGEKYKFEIKTRDGARLIKSDPYAFASELRPSTASVVADVDQFSFQDNEWMEKRKESYVNRPMTIYEVHLGSWRRGENGFLNYREIAPSLAAYCNEMGFTHVELLPVAEHPLDESWGYQVTGFYAVTSRYGTPSDFQFFVDYLHRHQVGVIIDWVPAHFPMDDFSLAQFDGSYLYEHADPKEGFHPHWNTYIFNYGRREVVNFLIGNALFWFDKMHIDGLRVDAVASMLYRDYGREEGNWIPNIYGGKENLEAIEFLKHLNSVVHEKFPGILMIAEESTAFTGVTHSLSGGGLGFDLKWNMGWMNDTLRYVEKDPFFRHYHQHFLTFGLLYAFSERFILVLSHDEVVHGKRSLFSKMPGDQWQCFANLRLLYSYMICQPGKKLLFMGGELAQVDEWYCKQQIHWFLLQYPYHHGIQKCVKALNHLYLNEPALWEKDFDWRGFEWVDFSDVTNSTISYLRKNGDSKLLCVHNFTPNFIPNYFIHLKNVKQIKEIMNTDLEDFGGSNKLNSHIRIENEGIIISLAPLATMVFKVND